MNRNQKEFQSHIDTKFNPQNAYVRDGKTIGRTLYNDEMYIFNHANNQKDFDSILNNASNNKMTTKTKPNSDEGGHKIRNILSALKEYGRFQGLRVS